MIKMVVAVYRKPGLSKAEFEDYWVHSHGPLVGIHGRTLGMRRYVQSHSIHAPDIEEFAKSRGWVEPPEGLAEVWWESKAAMEAAFATPEGQEASRILSEDEAKFCDMTRMSAFLSDEKEIFSDL